MQDDPHPHSIFSAQWEKPPASEITRFIILDVSWCSMLLDDRAKRHLDSSFVHL
jgi:hypothetical protein